MRLKRVKARYERIRRTTERLHAGFSGFYHNYLESSARFLFGIAGLVSFAIILIEFGFHYPASWSIWIRPLVTGILWYLILYEFFSFLFTRDTFFDHIRARGVELFLAVLVLIQFGFRGSLINYIEITGISAGGAALIFLAFSQILFLINNLIHLSRKIHTVGFVRIRPSVVFTLSFTIVILTGFALFLLPRSVNGNIGWVDLLFTAVSATCVTGLSTIQVATDLTMRGQFILMILIQIGGLGLMTLTSFFSMYLAGRYSLTDQLMMRELLSEDSMLEVKGLLKNIAVFTFIIEAAGAVAFYFSDRIDAGLPVYQKIFHSVFHSISAFCNAGFSLYPDSLVSAGTPGLLIVVSVLIMLGGIGFPVHTEIINRFRRGPGRMNFSTGFKLVLITNLVLWMLGVVVFFFLERESLLAGMNIESKILHSFFFTVTTRTAGFESLPVSSFSVITVFFSLLLMWIGASPVSTGGGIKTTTVTLTFLQIQSMIRGRSNVEVFGRTIQPASVTRAYSTVMLSLFVIFTGMFMVLLTDDHAFLDICFEVVSAFGTVGLSTGITPELSAPAKLVLCAVMLTGRTGVLTVLYSLIPKKETASYRYPGEYIITG